MTLTIAELRERIVSELGDDALQSMLDAAYEAITITAGAAGAISELIRAGSGDLVLLSRPATSVTSVTEAEQPLSADNYLLRDQLLQRLSTGSNPSSHWRGRVDVTYVPIDNTSERDRVAVELVKLDIAYQPALASQQLGDWREMYSKGVGGATYDSERRDIIASLAGPLLPI